MSMAVRACALIDGACVVRGTVDPCRIRRRSSCQNACAVQPECAHFVSNRVCSLSYTRVKPVKPSRNPPISPLSVFTALDFAWAGSV